MAARALCRQALVLALINVPTVSFGLALGWVSLASGAADGAADGAAGGAADDAAGGAAVLAAVTTFLASLAGVPLGARALASGRKLAVIVTSGCFVTCWSLKLASVWGGAFGAAACLVAARAAAGLGGAAAWALAPLLAREMCGGRWRGAGAAALPLAHNAGVLLMYVAADARVPHRQVLWGCLALSVLHCFVFYFMPESPSFLAAKGKTKEARTALAWLHGLSPHDPALDREMDALPQPEPYELSPLKLVKDMFSDPRRRRAFIIGGIAVVGQEACGMLAILQYAERLFALAREAQPAAPATAEVAAAPASPARHAVLLGAVQLVASALALHLVERLGRRPLIVWSALGTGAALAAAAALVARGAGGAPYALAVAVAADSAGLQPAPYSLLADMFHYQFRSCALMLISAAACAGNAVEVAVFPVVTAYGGLVAALALAAGLTLAYAAFAAVAIPETRGRTPEEIYEAIGPKKVNDAENSTQVATKQVQVISSVENEKEKLANVMNFVIKEIRNSETRCTSL